MASQPNPREVVIGITCAQIPRYLGSKDIVPTYIVLAEHITQVTPIIWSIPILDTYLPVFPERNTVTV